MGPLHPFRVVPTHLYSAASDGSIDHFVPRCRADRSLERPPTTVSLEVASRINHTSAPDDKSWSVFEMRPGGVGVSSNNSESRHVAVDHDQ